MVIVGTLFHHKKFHNISWASPDHKTQNQIDHIAVSRKWRTSLLDVRNKRGADINSDHNLIVPSFEIKIKAIKGKFAQQIKRQNVRRLRKAEIVFKN
jgi:hypothetical protein